MAEREMYCGLGRAGSQFLGADVADPSVQRQGPCSVPDEFHHRHRRRASSSRTRPYGGRMLYLFGRFTSLTSLSRPCVDVLGAWTDRTVPVLPAGHGPQTVTLTSPKSPMPEPRSRDPGRLPH